MSDNYASLEEMLKNTSYNKPEFCERCRGTLKYVGVGEYQCLICRHKMLDDYGKIRRFVDETGKASALEISRNTGVSREVIEKLISEGTLVNADDNDDKKKKCENCGKEISAGRYCRECTLELMNALKKELNSGKPQKQDKTPENRGTARMHHFRKK